jgi:hypothetical protein
VDVFALQYDGSRGLPVLEKGIKDLGAVTVQSPDGKEGLLPF